MKNILIIALLSLFGCSSSIYIAPGSSNYPGSSNIIILNDIRNNTLNMYRASGTFFITGQYYGDKLHIKNMDGVTLIFNEKTLLSAEIVLDNICNSVIDGNRNLTINEHGIILNNEIHGLTIQNSMITNSDVGIEALTKINELILNNVDFENINGSAINITPRSSMSKEVPVTSDRLVIKECFIRNCGLNGILFSNVSGFMISDNSIVNCGYMGQFDNNFSIKIKDSDGFIDDNLFSNSKYENSIIYLNTLTD